MNLVDFQSEVFDIIHTFSGQANKIVVNTVFIDLVDDLETGLFYHNLSIGRSYNKRRWLFYKTDSEWHEEIRISKYGVRKARKS